MATAYVLWQHCPSRFPRVSSGRTAARERSTPGDLHRTAEGIWGMDHSGKSTGAASAYRGLVIASLLLPLLALIAGGWIAWNVTLRDARGALLRAAAAASEQGAKVLDTHRLIAAQVGDLLGGMDAAAVTAHAAALRDRMSAMIRHFPEIAAVTVTDGEGRALVSTSDYPVDAKAAAPFLHALHDPGVPFAIGRVVADRLSGQSVLAVGIPWGDARRPRSGLILTTASPEHFAAGDIASPGGEGDWFASLMRSDGTELTRDSAADPAMERNPAPRHSDLAGSAGGTVSVRSYADGQEWLVAYARLPNYPVYASVARSWSSIVAQWRALVGSHLIFGIPATLALVALSLLAARLARRQDAAAADLQAEHQRRETAEDALRQAQKMQAVGQLTSGIAHDFNNHLTVISSNVELLKRRTPPDAQALLPLADAAMQGVQRAAALTHRLLAFARQQPLEPEPLDLGRLIDGMTDLLRTTLGETVAVELAGGNSLWQTRVDANQMESAILHLAVNARDAMPDGGTLMIELTNVHLGVAPQEGAAAGDYVRIAVTDTGAGMSPEVVAKAREPFFTTKPPGNGTGTGLPMVDGFVRQSGGHMTIASAKDRGTTVTLFLPRHVAAMEVRAAHVQKSAAAPGGEAGETVLVVEDDEAVRRSAVQALHEIGYQVLEAPDAMEAIRLIADRGGIDLLFTDVGLPGGVDGRALADAARTANPEIRILFTTGYARHAVRQACSGSGGTHFLAKPFTLEQLGVKVREVLKAPLSEPA